MEIKQQQIHTVPLSTQEIMVLLSTIATANDSDERQGEVESLTVEVRNWIVNRLLTKLHITKEVQA